ncbi:MAG: hypothetical protein KF824_03180 [Fimbriimonadaceae bacterium]|nr:MAG: hypothetical protein KF824_03180 [Fimbriimonadaceae bacterium]
MVSFLLATLIAPLHPQDKAPEPDFRITQKRTLEISGSPYIPVGLKIEPTPEAIAQAQAAGITDVLVELPLDAELWKRTIAELEAKGMRYVIGLSSLAPAAEVVAIEPTSYRVSGLQGEINIDLSIPGGQKAYAVLASEENGGIVWQGVLPIHNNRLVFQKNVSSQFSNVLVIYPIVKDQRMVDYWEGFDQYRDQLLTILRQAKPGPGMQALLNPLGKVLRGFTNEDPFVPTSELFRVELESFLKQKYGTPQLVTSAWNLGFSEMNSFNELARTVPLWQGQRGIDSVWNLARDKAIPAERRSRIWDDIRAVILSSASRRLNRLVDAVKASTGKPVIQDWNGWGGAYEDQAGSLDAVGFRLEAQNIINVIDGTSRPLSSATRRARPMATIATQIQLRGEDAPSVSSTIRQMESMGVRGWFFTARTAEDRQAVAEAASLYRDSANIANGSPEILYFPEAAMNPAVAGRLPGGYLWLPAPGSGERLDLGEGLEGYRYSDGRRTSFAFWAVGQPRRIKMRLGSEELPQFKVVDGSDLQLKQKKLELEMTVPTSPVILENAQELPVPVDSFEYSKIGVSYMIDTFGSLVDFNGTEYVRLKGFSESFERSPNATFLGLRQQLRTLIVRAAPYNWIEAENPFSTNFGDIATVSGSSDGKTLMLNAKVVSSRPHIAQYMVKNRLGGQQDVWIAARMDDITRRTLQIAFGGQELPIQPNPVSFYGSGFGWYRCGQVEIPEGQSVMTISAPGNELLKCDLDVIMISPPGFIPNGPYPPSGWLWDAVNQARPPQGTD